jgi:hypothetical protein
MHPQGKEQLNSLPGVKLPETTTTTRAMRGSWALYRAHTQAHEKGCNGVYSNRLAPRADFAWMAI